MTTKVMCVTAAALSFGISLFAADVSVGTWKLNLEKSTYSPELPPMSSIIVIEPSGDNGVKVSVETINAKGAKIRIAYSANFDGKEYPFSQSGPGAAANQTVAFKQIDPQTVERTNYVDGKPAGKESWVVSKDGKVRTVTQTGMTSDGKPIHNVLVQDRR